MLKINKDVKEFLTKNKKRYEIFENLQEKLNNLCEDSYQEAIQYVRDHDDIFFKDHANALFFLFTIICISESNFKKLELFLDIVVHFSEDFEKQNLTKKEIIAICILYPNTINYLFYKNFFSVETIIELSSGFKFLFSNFYHEIVSYDSEYALLIERKLLADEYYTSDEEEVNFLYYFQNNREEHILNRELNYHPSSLHKSIRDDDINTFQSLLSKNNYDINHKFGNSYYERLISNDSNLSLIEIASAYGSTKVFKFLWMQDQIDIPDNLLKFAYLGCNNEIIHICETKCKRCRAYNVPINLHRFDLFDYYVENFADEIEEDEDEDVKTKLKNFVDDEEDNKYKCLNVECLLEAVSSLNIKLLKILLPKIVFIMKNNNYSNPNTLLTSNEPFLNSSAYDLELYKFLYYQEKK